MITRAFSVAVAGVLACSLAAEAAIIASDDFDYPDGPMDGTVGNAVDGWAGPWASNNRFSIESGQLRYDPSGWENGMGLNRDLATAVSDTLYFSYVFDPHFGNRASGEVYLGDKSQNNGESFVFKISRWNGNPSWSFNTTGDEGGSTPSMSLVSPPDNDGSAGPMLLVGKIEWNVNGDGDERLSFWLNPTAPAPADAILEKDAGITLVDRVRVGGWEDGSSDSYALFDDLVLGTEWTDVAPIPEPTSLALLGLGGLALMRRR